MSMARGFTAGFSAELPADVADFFDSYRRAFERYDVEAVADHFGYPIHVTSDADVVTLRAVATRQEWMTQVDRLLGMYRVLGVHSAQMLESSANALSEHLVLATARWVLADAEAHPLYQFSVAYTLARIGGIVQIVALAHDELPRYQAALARLRSGG